MIAKRAPISYNDLTYLPVIVLLGYLPPISVTTNPQTVSGHVTGNGVYLYERSITPDNGLFRLASFTNVIRYANLMQWSIVITLSVTALATLTKYEIAPEYPRCLHLPRRSASWT